MHLTEASKVARAVSVPLTVAVRLQLYKMASSPKTSPHIRDLSCRPPWVTTSSPAEREREGERERERERKRVSKSKRVSERERDRERERERV